MEREQINFEVVNKGKVPEIKIYGYIGKWDEVNLEGLKRKIEAVVAKNDEVKLLINSGGGSVLEGFAIYDMLAKADIKVHAVVEGMAASMASIILLAADNIDIYENARIMTHKPKAGWWGEADGMRGMADTMDDM
ncbi:Clp protease ClpP, partial [Bacillus mycoides]|uniref:Clp protease ClpP n=1 Tax=Bacillus mycoides TaxID=1405 RepID=UPI003D650B30